jgi:regulator of sigma E protease
MSYFLAFAGFAALIILHEFGHFAAAKAVGMRVERFALFFPPLIATFRRGETEYGIGAVPLGGYVKITGMNPNEDIPEEVAHRAYYRQAVWKRIVVIAAGPAMNFLIAFGILWSLFVFRGEAVSTNKVEAITKDAPAAGVLRPGDELLAVDGVRGDPQRLREQIATHRCAGAQRPRCPAQRPARLDVRRDGAARVVSVTPRYDPQVKRPLIGFAFATRNQKAGPVSAVGKSVSGMWAVTRATVSAITRIFYDSKARKEVSGVVGSYETTRQVIKKFGFVDALNILAIISLSLAVVNLFPFLPLDGGHIFWAIAERLRGGRAIPFRTMERASVIGFMLVAVLFFIGLSNDIGRLQGEGFKVR